MNNPEPTKPLDPADFYVTDAFVPEAPRHSADVTLGVLVRYLFGSREAILTLANHRHTLWLGLVFVISAALAREYDGADLLHEPWHLLLPLVASLGTSFVLFCLVSVVALNRKAKLPGFWAGYRTFFSLYWMTAPLAWLYAIPVERFLTAGGAAATNLWLLAIVSLWRVLLITRVCSVLLKASPIGLFFVVMLFADTLAIALVSLIDVQVMAVMGGVRMSDAEYALGAAKVLVILFGVLGGPIWFIGTIVVAFYKLPKWSWAASVDPSARRISSPARSLAIGSVAVWGLILPWTQWEQQLRGAVERDFRAGRFREMLSTMSAQQRDDFPPQWNPPPRIGASRERLQILKIMLAISPDTAPWVSALFLDKLDAALGWSNYEPHETLWVEADPAEIISIVERQPGGDMLLQRRIEAIMQVPSVTGKSFDSALLRIIPIPLERSAATRNREWSDADATAWNEFAWRLQMIGDRKLVLKVHGARLKNVYDDPFTPEYVLVQVRKLLSIPEPEEPKPVRRRRP